MTFLGLDIRTDLPKVSYVTALDYYVAVCFGFVISTIIQFAVVHYYTKYSTGDMNMAWSCSEDSEDSGEVLVSFRCFIFTLLLIPTCTKLA